MAGITLYAANAALNAVVGRAAFPTVGVTYAALLATVSGTQSTLTYTEPSAVNGYARAAISSSVWSAPVDNVSPPYATISNAVAVSFPASTSSWGSVLAWALFDGPGTAANMLWWDWLGAYPWLPFYAVSGAGNANGVLDVANHGYSNGDQVVLTAEFGGTLPTSASDLTVPLTVAGVAGDTFNCGVITSSSGSGMVRKIAPQSVGASMVVTLNASALILQL